MSSNIIYKTIDRIKVYILLPLSTLILLFYGISEIAENKRISNANADFNNFNITQFKSEKYVNGNINYLLDQFAENQNTNSLFFINLPKKTSSKYFIMPIINDNFSEEMYIAVESGKKNEWKKFYNISTDTLKYLQGKADYPNSNYDFKGKIKPMDDELKGYMIEWFDQTNWFDITESNDVSQHIIPYIIYSQSSTKAYFIIAVSFLFALIWIIMIFLKIKTNRLNKNKGEQS